MEGVTYTGKYLQFINHDGWEYVKRIGCRSAVVIIPETKDNCVILIEQARKPFFLSVIEFPAGLVGDKDEDEKVSEAAYRELREETGYIPVDSQMDYFGCFSTSPGLTNELVQIVRLKVKKDKTAIPEEGIIVHKVPKINLVPWLKSKSITNEISDKVMMYALKYEDLKESSFITLFREIVRCYLSNMVGWTILICLSFLIGSCTIRTIFDMWK